MNFPVIIELLYFIYYYLYIYFFSSSLITVFFILGDKKELAAFPIGWLLPTKPRKNSRYGYVNYKGSLTIPPCSEIIDWVVITGRTLEISQELVRMFLNYLISPVDP